MMRPITAVLLAATALAACGCGVKVVEGPDLGLDFRPYVPRDTVI